ncbi:MAG: hypothetical protein L0387_37415 [Acidobacteria bacterium]|nr:hypothetical protein [Acidobacteriota bacterium]MCI0720537.1 hypothetical protein [Acidobacteriota bacterium]
MPDGYEEKRFDWIYSRMTLIREFEEQVNRDFLPGRLVGAIHLVALPQRSQPWSLQKPLVPSNNHRRGSPTTSRK